MLAGHMLEQEMAYKLTRYHHPSKFRRLATEKQHVILLIAVALAVLISVKKQNYDTKSKQTIYETFNANFTYRNPGQLRSPRGNFAHPINPHISGTNRPIWPKLCRYYFFMSGMNVLKVGPDRIIGSRDMGVSEVAPGKRSCPGLRYL